MKKSRAAVLAVIALASTAGVATAKDSTWMVCNGVAEHGAGADLEKSYLVVTLLEHRGPKDTSRELDVTMIYGDHVSHGALHGTNGSDATGTLELRTLTGKSRFAYTGSGVLANDFTTFTMKGSVDWSFGDDPKAARQPLRATLTCTSLDDAALAH